MLTPKSHNPQDISDYRPIFLISSVYKSIFKLLAERLKAEIDKFISKSQPAFILGRNMLEGVIMVNELVDFAKRNMKELFIFKVSVEKVFDSVSWEYLFFFINHMIFKNRWIKWIRACVCSNFISVLINGSPSREFQAKRGLCQGDPLFPFLYLIVAEGLVGLMHNAYSLDCFHAFTLSLNFILIY